MSCSVASDNARTLKSIVVSAQHSGASYLVSIITSLLRGSGLTSPRVIREELLNFSDFYLTQVVRETFSKFGVTQDLYCGGSSQRLADEAGFVSLPQAERVYFGRLFGIRGSGNFLLITSCPREVQLDEEVLSRQMTSAPWLQDAFYSGLKKYAAIRNPIDIICSSCLSPIRGTSEYLEQFGQGQSKSHIWRALALANLTDMTFVKGCIVSLQGVLTDYASVADHFTSISWEHLSKEPCQTICSIASGLGIDCDTQLAEAIWRPLDLASLNQNAWSLEGRSELSDDWKDYLIGEHLEALLTSEFGELMSSLGYHPIQPMRSAAYNPFQRLVRSYVQRGEKYDLIEDDEIRRLSNQRHRLAINQGPVVGSSNRKAWIEHSSLSDEKLALSVAEAANQACEDIDRMLVAAISGDASRSRHLALELASRLQNPQAGELLKGLPVG